MTKCEGCGQAFDAMKGRIRIPHTRCEDCVKTGRDSYESPGVRDEATFEGMALKCSHIGEECGAGASGAS
jgi:predicted nucleic acid-binding Zn ribbon protein